MVGACVQSGNGCSRDRFGSSQFAQIRSCILLLQSLRSHSTRALSHGSNMVVHPCLVPKAEAALNSLEIASGEVSASTDVGQALLGAKTHIHALLRDPIGVSNRIIAQAVDLVYFAEYLMEREPDSIHEARNNIHDVMVLAVRRGTQPHDWEGMLRSFSRAFLRDVETLDILMVSRLGNSCRHLFGEDPDPKKKTKRERAKKQHHKPRWRDRFGDARAVMAEVRSLRAASAPPRLSLPAGPRTTEAVGANATFPAVADTNTGRIDEVHSIPYCHAWGRMCSGILRKQATHVRLEILSLILVEVEAQQASSSSGPSEAIQSASYICLRCGLYDPSGSLYREGIWEDSLEGTVKISLFLGRTP